MSGDEMNRRHMLKLLLAFSSVSGFSMLLACQTNQTRPALDGLKSDTVEIIGRFYLNQFPHDQEVETVKKILTDTKKSSEEVIKQLQQLMRNDFEMNQTVNLFGWNISRTEARILAAAADMMKL